jgi:hypothetical protein
MFRARSHLNKTPPFLVQYTLFERKICDDNELSASADFESKAGRVVQRVKVEAMCLWQEATTSNDQIHASELHLIDRRLLGGESTDLIRGNHGVLALLLGTNGGRSSRLIAGIDTSSICLTACSKSLVAVGLVWIGRDGDIPDSNSAICTTGTED